MKQKQNFKLYIFCFLGIFVILIFCWFFFPAHLPNFGQGQSKQITTKQAAIKQITTKQVNTKQKLKNLKQVSLSFKKSGSLQKLNVKVGSIVEADQILASLDQSDSTIAVETAKAGVQSAASKLQKIKNGTTPGEIGVAQATAETALVALNNAQSNYQAVISEQAVKVKDAYNTMLNSIPFSVIPASTNIGTAKLTVTGSYLGLDQGVYKISIDYPSAIFVSGLETWHSGPITPGIPMAFGNNGLFVTFSTDLINRNDSWTVPIPNTTSILYVKNYNAYQEELQTQSKAISSALGSINTTQAQYKQAQSQLALT